MTPVLIQSDQPTLRETLRRALDAEGMQVSFDDAAPWAVAIVDRSRAAGGPAAAARVVARLRAGADAAQAKVIVLAPCGEAAAFARALDGAAEAVLDARRPLKAILGAVWIVRAGDTVAPRADGPAGADLPANLSPREGQILRRLAAGRPNKEIAAELGISQSTVKVHLRGLFRKLGVRNRTQAALKCPPLRSQAED
ncbi:helix-turn-helix transcriptional regulator [Oceanicella actignis]|uniref:DNA-binding response regulator, NarL/FixJ family, contains REC and HTH domains n=2 Tax=Oceanicella actignis TaxID=1189325 RepID=A0A1M7SPQ5_9RHOB|nr:response regulator transcription factor [Oceanicella actignis]TYO90839.1 LuxR family two component transcriptional regulator [Oceanicella actignis]SES66176.1 two component transcriptional regulator, LuxR family [Oceanicella actignis]SHN60442.1 DNA-binding response regulator, NarL/FixJ family, contains REC and HTH domains [Oceanicella actignis]